MYDRMFTNIKKQAERVIPTNEGDYLGDGSVLLHANGAILRDENGAALNDKGLLYCGRCHTLKQTRIYSAVMGRLFEPKCLCRCASEQEDLLERELQEEQFRMRLERMRKNADPLLLSNTFEKDEEPMSDASRLCRDYLDRFSPFFYPRGAGLYLCGGVGVGKTFYACCIANGAAEQGYTVRAMSVNRMINDLFSASDKSGLIRSLVSADLLIIDDLGAQRKTEYASEQVFTVIDERYKTQKPLIVTSNLPYHSLKETKDVTEQRIADRIVDMCVPIKVSGGSKRKKPKTS